MTTPTAAAADDGDAYTAAAAATTSASAVGSGDELADAATALVGASDRTEGGSATSTTASLCPYEFLVAIDMESTCDENHANPGDVKVRKDQAELIEISFAVVDVAHARIVHHQQIYVKPEKTPLTLFCTNLTGISAAHLEDADTLQSAIETLNRFIENNFTSQSKTFCFVAHGDWDLRYQLPRECREKNVNLESYFGIYFDVATECNNWLSFQRQRTVPVKTSIVGLCQTMGLVHEGRLHSGLDDAMSVARISIKILEEFGSRSKSVADVPLRGGALPFQTPINVLAQEAEFFASQSTYLMLGGLPFKATHGDVESFVRLAGVSAKELFMNRNAEGRPDGTGYAVFYNHDDASSALSLNGRMMGERIIVVKPANESSFQSAAGMMAPFPVMQPAPSLKAGDWLCPSCQYHNFAVRRNCMKCYTANPNAPAGGPSGSHLVIGGKPGDWLCPNHSCRFQNYASRYECMKCQTPRPGGGGGGYGGGHRASSYSGNAGPRLLPGDWLCARCQTHNFSSRVQCLRCGGPVTPGGAGPGGFVPQTGARYRPTDRPGDWNCPSETCRYHNYSSRQACYRCGTKKDANTAGGGGGAIAAASPPGYGQPAAGYGAPAGGGFFGSTGYPGYPGSAGAPGTAAASGAAAAAAAQGGAGAYAAQQAYYSNLYSAPGVRPPDAQRLQGPAGLGQLVGYQQQQQAQAATSSIVAAMQQSQAAQQYGAAPDYSAAYGYGAYGFGAGAGYRTQ
ncbi:hypothetical protein DFJ73DRAFT_619771 [Zopfochytrium polystomum]|nr:hypothetical protein DFJ73DRAFT_619771 [Zopfochytrium polystomum]